MEINKVMLNYILSVYLINGSEHNGDALTKKPKHYMLM